MDRVGSQGGGLLGGAVTEEMRVGTGDLTLGTGDFGCINGLIGLNCDWGAGLTLAITGAPCWGPD